MTSEFLIIGSGIAGLRAAVDLANHGDVLILTKAELTESNTGYAQGGIAAAIGPGDSPQLHFDDTLSAGDGLCEPGAVRVLVDEGVRYVRELAAWGAAFDREDGALALAREGAHQVRRVLHAKDATGREIGRVLWERAASHPRVRVMQQDRATGLLLRAGTCIGARFAGRDGEGHIEAGSTLLATGGAGRVFRETSNPPIATGDGVALAWRTGARVADLEFVQFHPTVLNVELAPRFLLSEALRGEGARLVNEAGERFMPRYEPEGELASRDLVSRAIVREAARTGAPVYLSLQHLDSAWVHERFPTIAAACRAAGLDLARDRIPVGPAAHYVMGGVETDLWGRTTVAGLYAAGEVACTGVHGANRLASNSLLEGLVFGARAAEAMREEPRAGQMANVREYRGAGNGGRGTGDGGWGVGEHELPSETEVQDLMWTHVGLVRDRAGLTAAVEALGRWERATEAALASGAEIDHHLWRVASIVTVGGLMARAALRREESRGGHSRTDFPARDDINWQVHIAERHGNQ